MPHGGNMESIAIDKIQFPKTLLLTVAIGLWLYWLWTRRHWYWFSLKFPGYLGLPIIGVMGKLIKSQNLLTFGGQVFAKSKLNTVLIWFGLYPMLLTNDPDLIGETLSSPELLHKPKTIYQPIYSLSNFGGILASPVSEWHNNRKLINPSFHNKVLLSMFPVFNKTRNCAISKLNTLVGNGEHKLDDVLRMISLKTTVETTMGKIMNDGDQVIADLSETYSNCFEKALHESVLSFLNLGWVMNLNTKYSKLRRDIHSFVNELVLDKISKDNDTSETNNLEDKLEHLVQRDIDNQDPIEEKPTYIFIDQAIAIYKNKRFSFNDIIAESNTIVAASFDTSAGVLFSSLVMLAMHPEIQERLFEEIINVFPEKTSEVQYEHLKDMPYLNMVVSEVLRLVPPLPVIARNVVKDTQLSSGLVLPKDIQIMISIFHLHRRTDLWGPNADKFDPEHFLPANLMGKHPYAFIPFSKGKRNCIGWRYADLFIKTVLSGLIRNFKFTTSFKYENIEFLAYITLRYINEPMFEIQLRE